MDASPTRPMTHVVRYLARDTSLNVVPVAGNRAAEALFSDLHGAGLFCEAVQRDGGQVFEIAWAKS